MLNAATKAYRKHMRRVFKMENLVDWNDMDLEDPMQKIYYDRVQEARDKMNKIGDLIPTKHERNCYRISTKYLNHYAWRISRRGRKNAI